MAKSKKGKSKKANVRNEAYCKALGLRIIELRYAKKWSQEHLANLAGIPINQIGRIERGEINTSVSSIYAISKALGMTPAEVYDFPFKDKK